jgi:hypothetical protein
VVYFYGGKRSHPWVQAVSPILSLKKRQSHYEIPTWKYRDETCAKFKREPGEQRKIFPFYHQATKNGKKQVIAVFHSEEPACRRLML